MPPLLTHQTVLKVPRRSTPSAVQWARTARLLAPVPLLGLLSLPLGGLVLVQARRTSNRTARDAARSALIASGGVHAVIAVFAFLVAAIA